jgi:hypothetical protein
MTMRIESLRQYAAALVCLTLVAAQSPPQGQRPAMLTSASLPERGLRALRRASSFAIPRCHPFRRR